MNLVIRWLVRLYQLFLAAYPAGFRGEFKSEMQAAFDDQITSIGDGQQGLLLGAILHELQELPLAIVREYWLLIRNWSEEAVMGDVIRSQWAPEDAKPSLENGTQPDKATNPR